MYPKVFLIFNWTASCWLLLVVFKCIRREIDSGNVPQVFTVIILKRINKTWNPVFESAYQTQTLGEKKKFQLSRFEFQGRINFRRLHNIFQFGNITYNQTATSKLWSDLHFYSQIAKYIHCHSNKQLYWFFTAGAELLTVKVCMSIVQKAKLTGGKL